jgi:mycofactocin precursor
MGATEQSTTAAVPVPAVTPPIQEDTLVEEISIDGMCGVY